MLDQRGWRLKIGTVIPSTNTIVQPDFDDLRNQWHYDSYRAHQHP